MTTTRTRTGILIVSAMMLAIAVVHPATAEENVWGTDLDAALDRAVSDGRPVLVSFQAPWDVWCAKLKSDIFSVMAVQDRFDSFHLVEIDTDSQRDVAVRFGVEYLPTMLALDPQGNVLSRIEGFITAPDLCDRLDPVIAGEAEPEDPSEEEGPERATPGLDNPLPPLADKMDEVRGFLEEERVDRRVQMEQESILAEIERLIEEAQQAQSSSSGQGQGRQQGQRNQQRPGQQQPGQQGGQQEGQQGGRQAGSPAGQSNPAGGGGRGELNPLDAPKVERWGEFMEREREKLFTELPDTLPEEYREIMRRFTREVSE